MAYAQATAIDNFDLLDKVDQITFEAHTSYTGSPASTEALQKRTKLKAVAIVASCNRVTS